MDSTVFKTRSIAGTSKELLPFTGYDRASESSGVPATVVRAEPAFDIPDAHLAVSDLRTVGNARAKRCARRRTGGILLACIDVFKALNVVQMR